MSVLASTAVAGPRSAGIVAGLVVLASCSGPEAAPPTSDLGVRTLGDPIVEIGELEGSPEYTFGQLESVVRLPGGVIATSDANADRISLYDASGSYLRSWGRRGEGPGEFQNLSGLYPIGPDSLMAAERISGRLSVFDTDGNLARTLEGSALSGDSVFPLDSWLYRRFWVEGALTATERERAREALAGVPEPRSTPGYRFVRVDDDGRLWLRSPERSGGSHEWVRLDREGRPADIVELPERFRPTHVFGDTLFGVWTGESDVHFARGYTLRDGEGTRPVPTWLTEPDGTLSDDLIAPEEEDFMSEIRSAIRNMAGAQERHYSEHMTYTTAIDSLTTFEAPEAISVDFLRGDPRGWSAVFAHGAVDRVCALAYGYSTPPGWMPGMILCAPDPAEARAVSPTEERGG